MSGQQLVLPIEDNEANSMLETATLGAHVRRFLDGSKRFAKEERAKS
jgi:hypothetical protein